MNTREPFSQARDWQQQMPPSASISQPPSWNGSGTSQISRQNSDYLSPSNPFTVQPTSSPATTNTWNNPWANGSNTTGAVNGSNGFPPSNTPIPPNNIPPLHTKPPRRNTSSAGKILLFVGLALLLVTAGVTGVYLLSSSPSTPTSTASAKPTILPTPTLTVHMQHQLLAKQFVANMSLDDEIAQLLMVQYRYANAYSDNLDTMLNHQHVGAVIMYAEQINTKAQTIQDTSKMQQRSTIPVFISVDEEGWNVGRTKALYPNYYSYRMDARSISLSGDPNVATSQGKRTGEDLLSLGINMDLAPDIDVSTDDGYIGFDRRSFGSTPDQVIKYAGAYMKAMQATGIIGTVKHFPGIGSIPKGAQNDPHAALPTITKSKDKLYQDDIAPFTHFIQSTDPQERANVVMPTDVLVPAIDSTYPAELSHTFITDILRNELHFDGVILTDALVMGGVQLNGKALSLGESAVLALQAGNDMLEGANNATEVETMISAIKTAMQNGTLTKERIDDAATRIITLKMDSSLMPAKA